LVNVCPEFVKDELMPEIGRKVSGEKSNDWNDKLN